MQALLEENRSRIRAIIRKMTGSYNEDLEQEVCLKVWANRERYTEEGKFEQIPVISWLYSPGVYFWIICFGIIYCLYKKRFLTILPWAVLLLLWLTLMVSPVVVFRYAYPLVVSLPVMLAMIMGKYGEMEKKNEKTI